jgi:glucokinase
VGVVGMAGPVSNNVVTGATNIRHWGPQDGNKIAKDFGLKSFIFLNDFTAAGYGISVLQPKDYVVVGDSAKAELQEGARSVKIVVGPGTGLGQGILVKVNEDDLYETFPTEGGHVDFSVQTQEDFELVEFARDFIENSDNVENLRAKGKVGRMSVERLLAGPAVPLIYSFMKSKHPELEAYLETRDGKKFDEIKSKDVIQMAVVQKDPLCVKVVDKFIAQLGVETGNMALKTMPYGGVYLIGGVTNGVREYLLSNP